MPITGNWTVPTPRPTKVWVEVWGAGGSPSRAFHSHNADAGGGGAYSRKLIDLPTEGWTAGMNIPYAISNGGTEAAAPQNSTFASPSKCTAAPGNFSLGGAAASGVGDVKRSGGNGQDVTPVVPGGNGGGGGAGATRSADGVATSTITGATNGNPLCGHGGNGGTGGSPPQNGSNATVGPGNGGGGGGEGSPDSVCGTSNDGALAIWDASVINDFDTLINSGAAPIFTVGSPEPTPVNAKRFKRGFIL